MRPLLHLLEATRYQLRRASILLKSLSFPDEMLESDFAGDVLDTVFRIITATEMKITPDSLNLAEVHLYVLNRTIF